MPAETCIHVSKNFFLFAAFVICLSGLTGCATSYKEGSYENKVAGLDNVTEIGFAGNGYVSKSEGHSYAMAKAAEVSLQRGYKYFTLVDGEDFTEDYISGYSTSGSASNIQFVKGLSTTISSETTTPIRVVKPGYNYTIKMYKALEEIPTGTKYKDAEAIWKEHTYSAIREPLPKEAKFGVSLAVGVVVGDDDSYYDSEYYNYQGFAINPAVVYEIPFWDGWFSIVPGLELVTAFGEEYHETRDDWNERNAVKFSLGLPLPLRLNLWRLYFQGGLYYVILSNEGIFKGKGIVLGATGLTAGLGYRWNENLNFNANVRVVARDAIIKHTDVMTLSLGINYNFDWFSKLKSIKE